MRYKLVPSDIVPEPNQPLSGWFRSGIRSRRHGKTSSGSTPLPHVIIDTTSNSLGLL